MHLPGRIVLRTLRQAFKTRRDRLERNDTALITNLPEKLPILPVVRTHIDNAVDLQRFKELSQTGSQQIPVRHRVLDDVVTKTSDTRFQQLRQCHGVALLNTSE